MEIKRINQTDSEYNLKKKDEKEEEEEEEA